MATPTVINKDPFSQLHEYIMQRIRNDNSLKNLFRKQNIIDLMDTDYDPYKRGRNNSDYPQLTLTMQGVEFPQESSDSNFLAVQYAVTVETESLQVADTQGKGTLLYPLGFELLRVFKGMETRRYFFSDGMNFHLLDLQPGNMDVNDVSFESKGRVGWVMTIELLATIVLDKNWLTGVG